MKRYSVLLMDDKKELMRIIRLSGMDENEYDGESVVLDVEEYMPRPADVKKLETVIKRAADKLDREMGEKRNLDKLREYYMESLSLLLESIRAPKSGRENKVFILEPVLRERKSTTQSFVTKAVQYVKERYADRDISIGKVCRQLGVSTAYFSTVFKRETGKTFIEYLTDYRMGRAEELLLNTNEKMYLIAEKVGYSDPNYFSLVFKKRYGMSPSQYRTGKEGGHTQ